MGEALTDVFPPREDDGAYWESISGTWHMPIGTLLIFSLFANNVRTAGLIRMGEALIDVFRPREGDGACRESIGGTWHMSIAIGTILSFSLFANKARTVGPIGMGEALIDVFQPREDDGAYWESIGGTWHMPIGTLVIFSTSTGCGRCPDRRPSPSGGSIYRGPKRLEPGLEPGAGWKPDALPTELPWCSKMLMLHKTRVGKNYRRVLTSQTHSDVGRLSAWSVGERMQKNRPVSLLPCGARDQKND